MIREMRKKVLERNDLAYAPHLVRALIESEIPRLRYLDSTRRPCTPVRG